MNHNLYYDTNLVAAAFIGGNEAMSQAAFMMGISDEEANDRINAIKKDKKYKQKVAAEAAIILSRRRQLNSQMGNQTVLNNWVVQDNAYQLLLEAMGGGIRIPLWDEDPFKF